MQIRAYNDILGVGLGVNKSMMCYVAHCIICYKGCGYIYGADYSSHVCLACEMKEELKGLLDERTHSI